MGMHNASKSTIRNAIIESIMVLHEVIVPEYITLPTREQALREADLFYEASNFPRFIYFRYIG